MDKGTKRALSIVRLSSGGYLVGDVNLGLEDAGKYCEQHFATEDLDKALAFIKHAIEPTKPEAAPID